MKHVAMPKPKPQALHPRDHARKIVQKKEPAHTTSHTRLAVVRSQLVVFGSFLLNYLAPEISGVPLYVCRTFGSIFLAGRNEGQEVCCWKR